LREHSVITEEARLAGGAFEPVEQQLGGRIDLVVVLEA
jgi:hypothetical protein